MPAQLGIPPWLQPPEVGKMFLGGAQIGIEQARIGQQAQQLQAQQTQHEQQYLQEQQKLEIEHQYRQQQAAMQKQELQQAHQLNQIKIQDASRQSQARLQFESAVKSGMDPQKAFAQFGPGMMESASGLGSFYAAQARQKQLVNAPGIQFQTDPVTQARYAYGPTGSPVQQREPEAKMGETPAQKEADRAINSADDLIKKGIEVLGTAPTANVKDYWEKEIAKQKLFINDLLHETGRPVRHMDVEGQPRGEAKAPSGASSPPDLKIIRVYKKGERPESAPVASVPTSSSPSAPESSMSWTNPMSAVTAQIPNLVRKGLGAATSVGDLMQPKPSTKKSEYPDAPKNEKDRVVGEVYRISEGPLKGSIMKWRKDGKWEQYDAASDWIKENVVSPAGRAIKKAYHWVEG